MKAKDMIKMLSKLDSDMEVVMNDGDKFVAIEFETKIVPYKHSNGMYYKDEALVFSPKKRG